MEKTLTKNFGDPSFALTATGAAAGSTVTYVSSNPSVAIVDAATGMVTIIGAGVARITAIASAVGDYQQTSVSCELTVNAVAQNLTFAQSAITKIEGAAAFTQTVSGAVTDVTYRSDNTAVAEVDSTTGEVTIKGVGTATITAAAAETGNYLSAETSYVLTVKPSQVITPVGPAPDQDEDEQPEQDDSCDGTAADNCPAVVFTDVNTALWYHKAVDYALMNGIMSGMGGNTFQPNGNLSRAMMVQILYNMEGKPAVVGQSTFEDVSDGDWYHDAIVWANANGIVNGLSHTAFGPNGNITREQMVAILYRYAQYKGLDISARTPLTAYADHEKISAWAKENVAWGVAVGLISGTGNNELDPNGNATRAQIAQVMMNFCEVVAK